MKFIKRLLSAFCLFVLLYLFLSGLFVLAGMISAIAKILYGGPFLFGYNFMMGILR